MKIDLTKALIGGLMLLFGWCMFTAHNNEVAIATTQRDVYFWHIAKGGAVEADSAMFADNRLVGAYKGQMGLDFAQNVMIDAYNKLVAGDTRAAQESLLVGLERTGLRCRQSRVKGELECGH